MPRPRDGPVKAADMPMTISPARPGVGAEKITRSRAQHSRPEQAGIAVLLWRLKPEAQAREISTSACVVPIPSLARCGGYTMVTAGQDESPLKNQRFR